jgi:spore coat polysaccharide biosynthesis protein SpsF
MNVLAIIPATLQHDGQETGILAPIEGKPLLGYMLERVAAVGKLDALAVTTSQEPGDKPILEYCLAHGITCAAGPHDDLLARLLAAVRGANAKGGVMIDARNPLIDPGLIEQVVNLLQMTDGMLDWVGTTAARTYPMGMEIDGFTTAALEESDKRCSEPAQRRLGPAFLRQNPRLYRLLSVTASDDLVRPEVNLRLESSADVPRIEAILRHFAGRTDFSLAEVLRFLDSETASPA